LRDHAEQLEQRVQERTAQLQAQYARLETILRSTSDGIVVTDDGGAILQTNPVAQAWLTQTLSPEDAERLRETVRDLARRADERPEMVLELTGLGLQVNAAPISEPRLTLPPASGGPVGVEAAAVVAIHDVSHLKALDRMRSRFVSNVSHELRTPITTVKLYAALMRRRPEKWEEYLDALEREVDLQARLVEDILQISRIDAGRVDMKPRPTPINELTEVAVVSHQVLAQNRGLTLEHQPAEPGPVALVDPAQMMQVLNNLVRNAIHYTPEGGKVVISTSKGEAEGRVCHADRGGHRDRHPGRGTAAHLRTVLPGGRATADAGAGDRPGAGDRQGDRGTARRPGDGGEPGGRGQHLHCLAAYQQLAASGQQLAVSN